MLVPVKSDPDYWPINSSIKAINSVGLSDGKNVHSTLDIGSGRTIKMKTDTALDVQVGGRHYKDLAIQPVEYIHANKLPYLEGNVIKYVTRHRSKAGKQDIEKAIHYLQLILDMDYSEEVDESGNSASEFCDKCNAQDTVLDLAQVSAPWTNYVVESIPTPSPTPNK